MTDHREHSPRLLLIPPIGVKLTRTAHCAESARFDLPRRDTRGYKLPAVGFSQINMGMVVEIGPFGENRFELSGYLGSHFETTRADSGSNRDPNFGRICAKLTQHRTNRVSRNIRHSASPARVNYPNASG